MKKIYLAGSCSKDERNRMEEIAAALRAKGYKVYCPFEFKLPNAWDYSQEDWAKMVFDKDVAAINECDFIVMISDGRLSSAGTNWEQGYAYAKGKPVFVFQYTNYETSLMTYCGCTRFINLPTEINEKLDVFTCIAEYPYETWIRTRNRGLNLCSTILT